MFEDKLKELISKATESGSTNSLSIEDIRDWLSDYLAMREEEVEDFPEEEDKDHWDLIANDCNPNFNALFVVAFFCEEHVTFAVGKADPILLKNFTERDFPSDSKMVIPQLSQKFCLEKDTITDALPNIKNWL